MSNVIKLPTTTKLDVPVKDVLEGALNNDLAEVMVIGYESDGSLYVASSGSDLAELFLMAGITKAYLLKQFVSINEE